MNCPFNTTLSLPVPASCRAVNRKAGKIREFPEAELWCKDLHLHPALYTGVPDLSHRGWVRGTRSPHPCLLKGLRGGNWFTLETRFLLDEKNLNISVKRLNSTFLCQCRLRPHLKLWLVFDLSPGMQQQVDKALSLIGKKFKDLDLTNLYAPPPPPLTLPSLPMTSWVRMHSLAAFSHS